MENFWNTIYYFLYRGDYKFHLLLNRINPFYWINKIPLVKKSFAKRGVDLEKSVNDAFKNPKYGLSTLRSWGFLLLLVFFFCAGVGNLYFVLMHEQPNKYYPFILIFYVTIAAILNHFLVFKQDKYLIYFKKFDNKPKSEKQKWAWITFATTIGIILFLIGSFYLLSHQ